MYISLAGQQGNPEMLQKRQKQEKWAKREKCGVIVSPLSQNVWHIRDSLR